MRTDVKVGLVCVFAVVLAVVGYFALRSNKTRQPVMTPSSELSADSPSSVAPALSLSPPTSSVATSMPTTTSSVSFNDTPTTAPAGSSLNGGYSSMGTLNASPVIQPPSATTNPVLGGGLNSPPTLMPPGSSGGGSLLPPSSSGVPALSGGTGPTMSKSSGTIDLGHGSTGGITPYGGSSSSSSLSSSKSSKSSSSLAGSTGFDSGLGNSGLTNGSSTGSGSSLSITPSGAQKNYAIQKGDTLAVIAKHNSTSVKAIEAANPGVNPNRLKVGQKINIPATSVGIGSSTPSSTLSLGGLDSDLNTPSTHPSTGKHGTTTKKSSSKKSTSTTKKTTKSTGKLKSVAASNYKVKRGDTLRKIARAVYGDESLWRRIFRANRGDMASPEDIIPGQVIHLPSTR